MISVNRRTLYGEVYNDVRCLSSDEKPTEGIKNGSTLIEIDTGKRYLFDAANASWNEIDNSNVINTKAPVIINTASGAIASFDDGADDMPVRKLVANIEPVQDLHGYDSPWPGGGGKNLFDGEVEYGNLNNNGEPDFPNRSYLRTKNFIPLDSNTYYTVSGVDMTGLVNAQFYTLEYDANHTFIQGTRRSRGVGTQTLQTTESCAYVKMFWYSSDSISDDLADECQLELGSTATPWTPYSNICPISGWMGAEIERTGKNLWGGTLARGANVVFDTKPGQTYTVSAKLKGTKNCYLYIYSSVDRFQTTELVGRILTGQVISAVTFTAEAGKEYALWSDASYAEADKIQIELGSTATDYEPYSGNQISVTFPDEVGTVYGGTLTLNSDRTGTLVMEKGSVVLDGARHYNNPTIQSTGYYTHIIYIPKMNQPFDEVIMNSFVESLSYSNRTYSRMNMYGAGTNLFFTNLIETGSELKTYLNENPIRVVYKLATPVTYTLTAEQVNGILTTLYGINNIWADTGDVEVTYPADTKLYIDNKERALSEYEDRIEALEQAVAQLVAGE